ncbi:MAG TPA: beta-phosphoglucomutase family hydrolase [Acidimicrobiales bacterium]|nr:beta-phosphoglucomutase family hydrolase [Acidimicrobiales bacterium]
MRLRLPEAISACLFDLDGVVTRTAGLHAAAWKEAFDEFLERRSRRTSENFVPFDQVSDYDEYVDGRPRLDGARTFTRARGIELPVGTPEDPAECSTLYGIANHKNAVVLAMMKTRGVEVYPGSRRFLEVARRRALSTAVISSSANARAVLEAAGLEGFFDACVDGIVAMEAHLAGKPAPDTYLEAARRLHVAPRNAAVFEDALAGVEAGRAGGFGLVVGVDRTGQRAELAAHGADVVVDDVAELIDP